MSTQPKQNLDLNVPAEQPHQGGGSGKKSITWAQAILLMLFGVFIALILIEIGYRVLISELESPVVKTDRPKRYFYPEGVNDMRDFAYSHLKPPNTYRMFVVGDSFTFGTSLVFDDTFPKRLERIMNYRSSGPKVEVLNYGIPGYSSAHEVELVKRAVSRQADLIVVELTLNDAEMKPFHATYPFFDETGKPKLDSWIFQWWKSLKFIGTRLANAKSQQFFRQYYDDMYNKPENLQRFQNSFHVMKSLAEKSGSKFAVVIFPLFSHRLDAGYPFGKIHDKIHAILDAEKIQYLDLLGAFKNIPEGRLQIIPGDDAHPNEIAHRIATEKIYMWLQKKQIIPADVFVPNQSRDRHGYAPLLLHTDEGSGGAND